MGKLSKEKRSALMSKIRSRDTKPELKLKPMLEESGFVYQEVVDVAGDSIIVDFVDRENKVMVFVHGCFWHKCPEHFRAPKSNVEYWTRHIADNVRRDKEQIRSLEAAGWTVMVIWEHEVKTLNTEQEVRAWWREKTSSSSGHR